MRLRSVRKQLLASAFAISAVLNACREPRQPQVVRPDPLPQDPFIEVYFNQSQSSEYTEPYRQVSRSGDDLERVIVDAINNARSTVDVAIQELRLPNIARSLAQKHAAGVKVRVILENTYTRAWSDLSAAEVAKLDSRARSRYNEFLLLADRNGDRQLSPAEIGEADALVILRNAGVPIIDDTADGSKGSGLMHHKFIIIDNRTLVVGSANFTTSGVHGDFSSPDSRGNVNNLLKIESYDLATQFVREFNLMWGDGPEGQPNSVFGTKKPWRPAKLVSLGNSAIWVQFSPSSPTQPWSRSSNGLISKALSAATESLDLALFVFSEQKLANTLQSNRDRGVEIRTLIDPSFAYRYYSEALDMMGIVLANRCQYEANNRPWQNPIQTVGIPILPPGDRLHHKFAIVDRQTIITGSHNWSAAANHTNDETLLVIQNPTVAAHFVREFERLYDKSVLGITASLQRKLQAQQQDCPQIASSDNHPRKLINLNTATQKELETLPGIGPKLARRIIEARQQKPFASLADLDSVSGVGPKLLENLESRVTW